MFNVTSYTATQLSNATKTELRAACKHYGISYAALNNEGMRAALQEYCISASDHDAGETAASVHNLEPVVAPVVQEVPLVLTESPMVVVENNTVQNPEVLALTVQMDPVAAEFAAPLHLAGGKVTKVRAPRVQLPEANGVKHPKAGTKCAEIWVWCDAQMEAGTRPEAKALRAALTHLDNTTCTVQYYRWRKYHGISGR